MLAQPKQLPLHAFIHLLIVYSIRNPVIKPFPPYYYQRKITPNYSPFSSKNEKVELYIIRSNENWRLCGIENVLLSAKRGGKGMGSRNGVFSCFLRPHAAAKI